MVLVNTREKRVLRFGDNNLDNIVDDLYVTMRDKYKTYRHPNWSEFGAYDVGVWELERAIALGGRVAPICIPCQPRKDLQPLTTITSRVLGMETT